MRTRAIARSRYTLQDRFWALLDADGVDQPEHVVVEDVVERAYVLFFEAFAQVFGRHEAALAVGQVAASAISEGDERGVRESDDVGFAIDVKFCVDGVGVTRGDTVPHMGEAALISLPGKLGSYVEGSDERAHRPGIGQRRLRYCVTFVLCGLRHSFASRSATGINPSATNSAFTRSVPGLGGACSARRKPSSCLTRRAKTTAKAERLAKPVKKTLPPVILSD